MPTLLLVDGHSQAYRSYFGVKTPLMTRTGESTTAVYGFTRKLLSLLREYQPDYVAVAFDKGTTWRHADFPDYKATRDQMPDDMRSQLRRIEEVLEAFNIPIVTVPNYEADDVLGTLAQKAAADDIDVLILTGDRDLFQLIDNRVKILYTRGGPNPSTDLYGLDEVRQRYDNLTAAQFIDMKALVGDSSDNIPGVAGVGEKTAIKFLSEYGTLDGLYEHIDDIRGPKTQQNLREAEEQVRRNRKLVEIVTDLDVPFDREQFRLRGYDTDNIRRIFETLEFRSMLRELNLSGVPETTGDGQLALFAEDVEAMPTAEKHPYGCVKTREELAAVVNALAGATILSFDVETTAKDPMRAALVGLGLGWAKGEAAYIPVGHAQGDQLDWDEVRAALAPIFADETVPKLGHNIKYDVMVCERHGLHVAGPLHDTMTMAWLLDPASRTLDLKGLSSRELDWQMTEITALIGTGRKQTTIDQIAIDLVTGYCGADVDATLQLYELLRPRLEEADMWSLYERIELPLVPVLADIEMAGILVDTDVLAQMSNSLGVRLGEIERDLYRLVGREFNLRSTQQLSDVLFDEMGFPTRYMKKTRTGFYSTAAAELEKLTSDDSLSADQRSVLDLIFEHRQLEKLRGTYVDALPSLVHPETGRIHTSFNQTGSSTGRLSSSDPNLQNIPIRTEIGREIRKGFVAPHEWVLVAADYSQVELRILAHVTREPGLVEAFQQGLDIHTATAARLFGVPLEAVDREQRNLAKTINFATIYGISAYGLSSRTEMNPAEAQRFLDQYFATYPKVQKYITDTLVSVQQNGYVETLLGRKRFFPELVEGTRVAYNLRQGLERAAINAPIQGTAADIIKIAMIRLHSRLRDEGFQAHMLLQVHDELVLEAPMHELESVVKIVCDEMETAYTMSVPLKVDVEAGPNWYDMEKV